jgi:hypothetical protein
VPDEFLGLRCATRSQRIVLNCDCRSVSRRAKEGVAKFEEPLACARGSEWRLGVYKSLPSRDREGAVDRPNIATPSKARRATSNIDFLEKIE